MRWTVLNRALTACAMLAVFTFASPAPAEIESRNVVLFKVTHSKIDGAGTKDAPVVAFLDAEGNKYPPLTTTDLCTWNCFFASVALDPELNNIDMPRPAAIRVTATGSDAAFIDKVRLNYEQDVAYKIAQWGVDEGKGWCISTSPQIPAGWAPYVDGCHAEVTFQVSDQTAYVTNVDSPTYLQAGSDATIVILKQFFVKNRYTNDYLGSGGPEPSLTGNATMWQFEPAAAGYFNVRSTITGRYLRLAGGKLSLVFPLPADAASAGWKIVPLGEGFYRFCSQADETVCVNNESGALGAGAVQLGWWSAQWTLSQTRGPARQTAGP